MRPIPKALIPRASKIGVVLATAVTLAATSAALWTANAATPTPETIWGSKAPTPAVVDSEATAVELGTRFTAVTSGQATAIRFYKTPENSGLHTGSLWTSAGALLGRVTFSAESSTGWQSATLSSPVTLSAGGSYVVSYHTNVGRYMSSEYFAGSSSSANLRIPTSNAGVYAYGNTTTFPKSSWHSSQYWVDISFSTVQYTAPSASASATTSATSASTHPTFVPSSTSATPTASTTPTVSTSPTAPSTSASATTTTTTKPATSSAPPVSSAGMTNCASQPSRCGYPDATNTGPVAGVALQRVPQDVTSGPGWTWDSRGWLQASSGAVVKNLIVSGSINVAGSNVTVTNNKILADGESWGIGLQHSVNATITNNEIGILHGLPRLLVGIKDVYGDCVGTQILRNNVQNTSSGIQTHEGLTADNYIHDMGFSTGDHINGTTSNGNTEQMTIRHNTIFNQIYQTDAISLFQDFGLEANRVVTDNLLAGGGYTIYGGGGGKGVSYNIQVTNNRFSTLYFPNGGSYGPMMAFDYNGAGNVSSGNYWDNSLAPVNI